MSSDRQTAQGGKTESLLGLAGDISVYGIGTIISRLLGVLMTPILTRLFSVSEYGEIDILQSTLAIAVALSSLYMESGVMRYYSAQEQKDRATMLFTHLITVLTIGGAVFVIVFPFRGTISQAVLGVPKSGAVAAVLFTVISSLLFQHVITVLRTMRRAKTAVFFSIYTAGLQVPLTLWLVLKAGYGIESIFLARALAEISGSCIVILVIRREYSPKYSLAMLEKLLRFGIPLLPDIAIGIVIAYSTRYFIWNYQDLAALGLFAVGQKIASTVTILSAPFKSAWHAYAFSITSRADAKEIFSYVFSIYLKFMGLILIGLVLFAREIVLIFSTDQYLQATIVVGLLGLASVLQGLVYILNIGLLISERTKFYMLATGGTALITVGTAFLLIPYFGIFGAGIVHLFAQTAMVIAIYVLSRHFYPIRYRLDHLLVFMAGFILISFFTLDISHVPFGYRFLLGTIACFLSYLYCRREVGILKNFAYMKLGTTR